LKKVTDARGQSWDFEYEDDQRRLSVTDARGKTIAYTEDELHRTTRVEQPGGLVTDLGYDENSNLRTRTAPNGSTETVVYCQRALKTDPLSGV
jgi:YD repeat-containing protein